MRSGFSSPQRKPVSLLLAGLLAVAAVGCGGGDDPAPHADEPDLAVPPVVEDPATLPEAAPEEPGGVFVYPPPDDDLYADLPALPTADSPGGAFDDADQETDNDEGDEPDDTDATALPLDGRVIAIDPGHNGGNFDAPGIISQPVDAGGFTKPCNTTGATTNDGWRESTFNFELSLRLRQELERLGARVHLTRETDDGVGPCIDVRGQFGGSVGADLLISIHADGAPASGSGFHIIRPSGRPGTDLSIVEPSQVLAEQVRDALVDAGFSPANYIGTDGMVARDDLGTLNLSTVPAVLVEAGNMRNDADAQMLRDPAQQQRLAEALTAAILRFLDTPDD